MTYEGPWRNGDSFHSAMYNQHCRLDELQSWNPKLVRLLLKYGSAFDDQWNYWITNSSKRYVKRCPIWLNQRRIDVRNRRMFHQTRLLEAKK